MKTCRIFYRVPKSVNVKKGVGHLAMGRGLQVRKNKMDL